MTNTENANTEVKAENGKKPADSGWAKTWGKFEAKHPKLAKWLYQIFYFFVFSMGVTIIQYLFSLFFREYSGKGWRAQSLCGLRYIWISSAWSLHGACWDTMSFMMRQEP